jgi:hypothetical protein
MLLVHFERSIAAAKSIPRGKLVLAFVAVPAINAVETFSAFRLNIYFRTSVFTCLSGKT